MADVVEKEDINEALRLMEMSKQSLYEDETGSQYVNIYTHYYCIWPVDAIYILLLQKCETY